jgi:hypothetical protein
MHAFANICHTDKRVAQARIASAHDWHLQLHAAFADGGDPFDGTNAVFYDGACKALCVLAWYGPHVEYFSQSSKIVIPLFELLTSRRLKSRKQASWAIAALCPLSASGVIVVGTAAAKTVERIYDQTGGGKKGLG